jgi:hypothetical protein
MTQLRRDYFHRSAANHTSYVEFVDNFAGTFTMWIITIYLMPALLKWQNYFKKIKNPPHKILARNPHQNHLGIVTPPTSTLSQTASILCTSLGLLCIVLNIYVAIAVLVNCRVALRNVFYVIVNWRVAMQTFHCFRVLDSKFLHPVPQSLVCTTTPTGPPLCPGGHCSRCVSVHVGRAVFGSGVYDWNACAHFKGIG